jgi:predicted phage terminase large subunit-like protein
MNHDAKLYELHDKVYKQYVKDLAAHYVEKGDVLSWGRLFFPHKFTLPFCPVFHGYAVSIMHEPMTATLAPRGYAKTTIKCFLIPIYLAYNFPDLYKFFLNVQSTTSKGISVNLSIRHEIENNDLLRYVYGDMESEKWTEKLFQLKNGVVFSAIGAGESIRGLSIQNMRPDYIVVDDLYDDEDIISIERIEKKERWFWGTLYLARAKSKNNCVHIQGTAIHKKDLYHKAKENDTFKFRKFKAIVNEEKKTVLWKSLYTFDDLIRERERMTDIIFLREMQNEPQDLTTTVLKQEYFRYYVNLPTLRYRIITADTAQKSKEHNDYSVLSCWGIGQDKHAYLIDVLRGKWEAPELEHNTLAFWTKHKSINNGSLRMLYIEDKVSGTGLIQKIKRFHKIPVTGIKREKDKYTRVMDIIGWFASGYVYFPSKAPWLSDYERELLSFNAAGTQAHDDQVDVTADAVSILLDKPTGITDVFSAQLKDK